jgi:CubicO group peptidase (beta-lactamase class C family)/lysophospholipase L1-like esterase
MYSICVLGDSIAWGAWDATGGWVSRLRELLLADMTADRIESQDMTIVYNCSVGGDRIEDVARRLEPELAAYRPDFVVLAVGTNDSRQLDGPHSLSTFRARYHEVVSIVLGRGCELVLVTPPNVDADNTKTLYSNVRLRTLGKAILECGTTHGVPVVDLMDTLDCTDFSADGLHPSPLGHLQIFTRIATALLRIESLKGHVDSLAAASENITPVVTPPSGVRNLLAVIEGRIAVPHGREFVRLLGLPLSDPWSRQDNRQIIENLSIGGWMFEQLDHQLAKRRWRLRLRAPTGASQLVSLTPDEIEPSIFRLEVTPFPEPAISWEQVRRASTVTGTSGLASRLARLRSEEQISSAVMVVAMSGKVVERAQFGRERLVMGPRATERSLYRWGSVTKVLTALSILRLVGLGMLSLDVPVTAVTSGLRWTSPFAAEVRVEHLLMHSAGLARSAPIDVDLKLLFRPGTSRSYSNVGFNILANVISVVTGEPFESWVQREMFNRLGMDTARIEPYASDLKGYDRSFGLLWPAVQPRLDNGARGLTASCLDLARLSVDIVDHQEIFHGRPIGGVISHDRGLGVMVARHSNRTVAFHDGGVANSWQTFFCIEPRTGTAVVGAADSHPVGLEAMAVAVLTDRLESLRDVNPKC